VRIPEIFNLVNFYRVYGVEDWARQGYEQLQSSRFHGSADLCVECGACEEKCPQKINIRDELKKAHTLLTKAS
jgi:predicted aldo/keto reductase-like oxidoreductase